MEAGGGKWHCWQIVFPFAWTSSSGFGPPCGKVAGGATFGLDRCVHMDEWSGYRAVAFGAHHELPGSRWQRILSQCAVRIMAVSAVDQPFPNLMMKGRGELWLHVAVALEAEFGLLCLEQIPGCPFRMNDVTADATQIGLAVGRVFKVSPSGLMAFLAFFVHIFGCCA